MKKSAELIRNWTNRSLQLGLVAILASLLCLIGATGADAGTYSISSCGDCHTYPPTDAVGTRGTPTGAVIGDHRKHVTTYGYGCTTCHGAGVSSYTFNHRSGNINMGLTGTALGGSYTKGTSFPQVNDINGNNLGHCDNTYCHSNGTGGTLNSGDTRTVYTNSSPTWGKGAATCGTCHGAPPSYVNGTPKANMHGSHTAYGCQNCHYQTTNDGVSIASTTTHVNKLYNIVSGPGVTIGSYAYNVNGGKCSDISCHGGTGTTASWNVPGAVSCLTCHAQVQGARAAVVTDFSASSHHVQGTTLTTGHCYQCHWEATVTGKTTTFHQGTPGGSVDLVDWGNGTTRPTTTNATYIVSYFAASGRPEYVKLNQVCTGCHGDTNKNTAPFSGDSGTTAKYSWNGTSVEARYSSTTTVSWSTYTFGNVTPKYTQKKAYSAHGNAANNQRGWNLAEGWPNTSGTGNVLCIDCHNSHGSTVGANNQKTTSYVSAASNTYVGAMLKDVTASQGGYTANYKAVSGGTLTTPYSAGAALCFDCHMETNATTTRPWGYGTYGATQQIVSYEEKPYWYGASTTTNLAGRQQRYAYKANRTTMGGHFKASKPLATAAMGTIGGICTPCHDPHGVDGDTGYCDTNHAQYWTRATCQAALGTWTAAADHAVPLLKGTWVTSPYREDAGPQFTTNTKGGGSRFAGFSNTSIPGRHIDQNTFVVYPETNATGVASATTVTIGLYNLNNASTQNKINNTEGEFAGLCLRCHSKTSLTNTNAAISSWYTTTRIHNAVSGWANVNSVNNAGNKTHAYTCSKCHSPHQTCLPRLMLTNCMDWNHRGRVVSGGTQPPYNSTTTTSGGGNGRFPGGGGGYGSSGRVKGWSGTGSNSGKYFFGTQGNQKTPNVGSIPTCHYMATGGTNSLNHRWNTKTPW